MQSFDCIIKLMKRSWFQILIISVLLGLLILLAGLQYTWLGQISDAERVRLHSRLNDDTKRFTEDFNREIQTLYYGFQIDAENFENEDWRVFNQRLSFWKSQTKYSELVKDVYFIKKGENQTLLKYDNDKAAFEMQPPTDDLKEITKNLNDDEKFNSIIEKPSALIMPILRKGDEVKQIIVRTKSLNTEKLESTTKLRMPDRYGYLIVLLNENVIKNDIFPALVAKYFSGSESGDFKLSVVDTKSASVFQTDNETITIPDSTAKLFNLKPDNFLFFNKIVDNPMIEPPGKEGGKIIVRQNTSPVEDKKEVVSVNITGTEDSKPRVAVFNGAGEKSDGIWTLNVQHTSGSLDQFISNTRKKNLAISFGILLLLAVSIILIFVSAQRAKRLAQKQLDFVSGVSHEFRTPLAVIYSAGENLTDGVVNSDAQIERYGNLIKGEGKKLSGMVEQILEFAGARSGKRKYDFREVSVEKILAEAMHECQPLIDEKNFILETEIAESLPNISADEKALTQAVQNLIANSIKYSNGSNWLKISAENDDSNIKIAVEDKGIGISAKDQKHIFEPFYRGKKVVDEQISGNGLGLSLVKQIVQSHGGKIEVESEIGKGSKFIVHLPLNI